MAVTLDYTATISEGATDTAAVSFDKWLDSGELVASVTVTEVTSTDLTITNKAVSTAALTINGKSVAIGRAATFSLSGQSASASNTDGTGLYRIRVTPTTDSTPARVHPFDVLIQVV